MKSTMIALLFLLPLTSQAKLVIYSYDSPIVRSFYIDGELSDESFAATGILTADTIKRRLVSFDFASEPVTFNWDGEAALLMEPATGFQSNGFEKVYVPEQNAFFDIFLDTFFLAEGQDIFESLDVTRPDEGAFVGNASNGYSLTGTFEKVKTINVPEPATLTLLTLGLAAIAIRRRPR